MGRQFWGCRRLCTAPRLAVWLSHWLRRSKLQCCEAAHPMAERAMAEGAAWRRGLHGGQVPWRRRHVARNRRQSLSAKSQPKARALTQPCPLQGCSQRAGQSSVLIRASAGSGSVMINVCRFKLLNLWLLSVPKLYICHILYSVCPFSCAIIPSLEFKEIMIREL